MSIPLNHWLTIAWVIGWTIAMLTITAWAVVDHIRGE